MLLQWSREEGEEAVFYAASRGVGRREKFADRAKTMPLLRSSGAERRWLIANYGITKTRFFSNL